MTAVTPERGEGLAIIPAGCTGASLSFDPGVLHVSKDGSGYIAISEEHFSLEDDRCEGPDGPEGSVHWITRLGASEVLALRDFLNGTRPAPSPVTDEVVWLIERNTLTRAGFHWSAPMWWHPDCGWTHDASLALRFARREDAEAFRKFHCFPDEIAFVSEHAWPTDVPPKVAVTEHPHDRS